MNNFQYEVKHSDRKSICVRILSDNTIVVSCPKKTGAVAIEKFLKSKSKWIERHLKENSRKNELLADVIIYKKILIAGKAVPLNVDKLQINSVSADGVCVKSLKSLQKLYVSEFGDRFDELINQISGQATLNYSKYSFRDYKSRWGCCNRERELNFSWKLLMLPQEIWRYVIAHELCHTVYMNHSPKFYKLMETVMPEYKSLRRELETYSRIAKLY